MAAEDANLRNWRFGTFGDLATRVRNYASRGRESANYGGAILLGLTALEWEERAQHQAQWRFVTLYYGGKPWAGPSGIRLAIPIGVPWGGRLAVER